MTNERKYKIVSRAVLPVRMKGLFSFEEAHRMCCDWNSWHVSEDLAIPELEDGACYLENL